MLFLASGDPKQVRSCWVNTKSLDGETDNKYRQALEVSYEVCFQSLVYGLLSDFERDVE